jgi:hypothetical protein
LGIEKPTWGASPQGVTLGGFGLYVRTEDVARFGQLYLQKGILPRLGISCKTQRGGRKERRERGRR